MSRADFAGRSVTLALVSFALVHGASPALAFALRSPQVAFVTASVQQELDTHDGHIDAAAHQLLLQSFDHVLFSGVERFVLDRQTGVSIGFYNSALGTGTPPQFELFPPGAFAHSNVVCRATADGVLTVDRYDPDGAFVVSTTYTGFDRSQFGFCLSGPRGMVYMQDARNDGRPQVLSYAGTAAGGDYADLYVCFAAAPYDPVASTFFDAVVHYIIPVLVTPVGGPSWGRLKATYR